MACQTGTTPDMPEEASPVRKPLNPTTKKSVKRATALSTLAVLALAGCQAQASTTSGSESGSESPVLDQSVLHEVDVSVDEDELTSHDWVEADVTIDGEEYADAGVRLAGGLGARDREHDREHDGEHDREHDSGRGPGDPAEAPWLISLDQFVDDQSLDGITDLVVLGGDDTGEMLGEAVRLDLRAQHGPGDEVPVASSFSVNDSESRLRLLVPRPDGERPDSADAEEVLDKWVALLGDEAGDLIEPETLEDDAEELRERLADGDLGASGDGPHEGPGAPPRRRHRRGLRPRLPQGLRRGLRRGAPGWGPPAARQAR